MVALKEKSKKKIKYVQINPTKSMRLLYWKLENITEIKELNSVSSISTVIWKKKNLDSEI